MISGSILALSQRQNSVPLVLALALHFAMCFVKFGANAKIELQHLTEIPNSADIPHIVNIYHDIVADIPNIANIQHNVNVNLPRIPDFRHIAA